MSNSILGELTKGILSDYLGKNFTKKSLEEATARIVKSYLMTREGGNLPESGTATNFSDKEIKESKEESVAQQVEEKQKDPFEGTRVKAIVSMPDVGEDGDSAPITIRTRN